VRLAAILLLTVFGIHYLNDNVASFYAYMQQVAAAKAWEYVFTNAGLCVVLACVGLLARKPLVTAICVWGIVESAERVVCRLDRPIGGQPPVVELYSGLCGVKFYWIGLIVAVCLAIEWLDKFRETRNGPKR